MRRFVWLAVALVVLAGCSEGDSQPKPSRSQIDLQERQEAAAAASQDAEIQALDQAQDRLDDYLQFLDDQLDDLNSEYSSKDSPERQHEYDVLRQLNTAQRAMALQYKYFESTGADCPPTLPVKGNVSRTTDDRIFHAPGWRYYALTIPEECFATPADARKAGYRPSYVR